MTEGSKQTISERVGSALNTAAHEMRASANPESRTAADRVSRATGHRPRRAGVRGSNTTQIGEARRGKIQFILHSVSAARHARTEDQVLLRRPARNQFDVELKEGVAVHRI